MIDVKRVKARMKELDMTQKDIADVWHVALPTVSQKLNRVRPMNLDEAESLAKLLKIPDSEFCLYFFA